MCRIPMEMSSVQALMDLLLPRFAGLTDGLHQIHLPWSIASDSCEDDSKDLAERSDLSITLFCDSDEAGTRVNSDQVLSDGDFPEESVPEDKRQFVRRGQLRMIDSMIPLFLHNYIAWYSFYHVD